MDMHMPVMDGIKAAKEIRSLSRPDASVPIIAVTAEDSPQERERCMHAGMNGYLSKPFDQQTLYVELCSLLQGRSA
jgi:CheY-like chemotaxis protein